MKQQIPFRYPGTREDVGRLEGRLREAFLATGFHHSGWVSVLNLACGRADETGAIAAAIAPASIVHYLGIDLRADAIEEAAKRWRLAHGHIEFRCGDASRLLRSRQISPMDLVFIRHQNYWHDPAAWDRILQAALLLLKPAGMIACTSYFDQEHQLFLAAMRTSGARLLWNARDPFARDLPDAKGKSVDRHLALFAKPS